MNGYIEKPTQEERILEILKKADGGWVDGMLFLRLESPITQYHARIWGLQERGYEIEGRFIKGKGWKEYRLISEAFQGQLFEVPTVVRSGYMEI